MITQIQYLRGIAAIKADGTLAKIVQKWGI